MIISALNDPLTAISLDIIFECHDLDDFIHMTRLPSGIFATH